LLAHLAAAPAVQRQAHLRGELLTGGWSWVLSLASQPGALQAAVDLALEVTLRRKAVGLDAVAAQREVLISGRYPALASKLQELADLRFRVAGHVLAGAGPEGPAAQRERLAQLQAERDRLEAELARSVPELTLDRKLLVADRQAVAAALPAGSALLEFVLRRPYHFEAVAALDLDRWRPARYAAVMVLQGGRLVLVGMNRHTNEAGFQNLSEHLTAAGANVVCVRHRALHLDCCLAPLPKGEALVAADHLRPETLSLLGAHFRELISLDRREAALHLAANLLWLDQTQVVSSVAVPKTNHVLRSMGYQVHELDFTALTAMWGSLGSVLGLR
jgi:hypothetical protein